jgi:integrase/recombinase XerD
MKKKVFLRRLFHRGKPCISINFNYDEQVKSVVKTLRSYSFSSTNRCFYINDTEDDLREAMRALKEVAEVDISALAGSENVKEKSDNKPFAEEQADNSSLHDEDYGDGSDFTLDSETYSETIPDSENAGRQIRNRDRSDFGPVEFKVNESEGLLVIKFLGRYDGSWIGEMRSYGSCYYDKKRREWMLRWSKLTTDSLADYFSEMGIRVNVRKQDIEPQLLQERRITGDEIRARHLADMALNGLESMAMYLDENRYSPRTRESYMAALEFFFRYFSPRDPLDISQDEISLFIYDFIIKLGYSASYQNQMVSAIKTFYSISGKGKVNPEFFERPRRRRALPKVFSKEEVSLILNSTRNIKHKLVLWMIYSCGLRRSEVINIKLQDIDKDRNIVHIREGKGMVDRIVPLSMKVWEKIEDYLTSYKPKIFLFEGQKGGRYSSESVYHIFKESLHKAGINREVGVHCLRHSYATHLHESGLDIRYIQELLGHKSTRTTEIYTHVSRRNLIQVRSPIEDMDVK